MVSNAAEKSYNTNNLPLPINIKQDIIIHSKQLSLCMCFMFVYGVGICVGLWCYLFITVVSFVYYI